MRHALVIGAQWGDEGKGKIASYLASRFDVCVRFNGGSNAAHTVVHRGRTHKLRMLPVGALYQKKLLISQGTAIDGEVLRREIQTVEEVAGQVDLSIDHRAHLVMSYHRAQDAAHEAWRGRTPIGSTGCGIGFSFEDRNNRMGLRVGDLLNEQRFRERVEEVAPFKERILRNVYGLDLTLSIPQLIQELASYASVLRPYIADVSSLIRATAATNAFLFEGAQGALLDNAFGTYPYAVAYSTLSGSLFPSLGVPPFPVDVVGVLSSYATRNGCGPFPTEQRNSIGDTLQKVGHEFDVFGTPRRCGWLDLPSLRYAAGLNGFTALAVTRLDVLSALNQVSVCTGYRLKAVTTTSYSPSEPDFDQCVPVYRTFEGWPRAIAKARTERELPTTARSYIDFIATETGVPVKYVSVGPEAGATIEMS